MTTLESHSPLFEHVTQRYDATGLLKFTISVGMKTTPRKDHPLTITCLSCGESFSAAQYGSPCPKCGNCNSGFATSSNSVADEKVEVAKELARKHYQIESGITQILHFSHRDDIEIIRTEPIKLLEVNQNTVASGVMPLYFGPAPASGIPFSSVIVEVTPDEYLKILSHEMKLPAGWDHGEEMPRPTVCIGGV